MSPKPGGGGLRVSANEYSCAYGDQINFEDLNPYLTYDQLNAVGLNMKICWKGIYFCTCPPNVHYFAGGRQKGGKERTAKKVRFMYSQKSNFAASVPISTSMNL